MYRSKLFKVYFPVIPFGALHVSLVASLAEKLIWVMFWSRKVTPLPLRLLSVVSVDVSFPSMAEMETVPLLNV